VVGSSSHSNSRPL